MRDRRSIVTLAQSMITATEQLARLEAQFAREAYKGLTYAQALERFTALWQLVRELRPESADWLDDLEPDFAIARAVNGLPPAA